MLRPSRRLLYVLIATFLVLAVLKFVVVGLLANLLIVVLLVALLVYFVAVAVSEGMRSRQ